MLFETIELDKKQGVARVMLNRPDVRNAFNEKLIAELKTVFSELSLDPEIKVIILGGHGASFCAGADLNWMKKMANYSYDENMLDASALANMLHTIYQCPKPVIAKVHGDAYAGGLGVVAVCDIVIASNQANFCLSEAKLGLLPATISPYVIKAMGEQSSRRYFITAERFNADQARQMGLVHELADPDQLDDVVEKMIGTLLSNGPNAVMACKQLVKDVAGKEINDDLIKETAKRIADIRGTKEAQVRMANFLEKK